MDGKDDLSYKSLLSINQQSITILVSIMSTFKQQQKKIISYLVRDNIFLFLPLIYILLNWYRIIS